MIDRVLSSETEEECDGDLELELESFNREMKEAERLFLKRSPEEKAYAVIRLFFEQSKTDTDNGPNPLRDRFYGWLLSSENQEAKEAALNRMFEEILETHIDIPLRSFEHKEAAAN